MSRLNSYKARGGLFSIATPTAEIQLVASSRDLLVDLQATSYDVSGHRRLSHATAALTLDDAIRLEMVLSDAISAVLAIDDPRQTALWSPATYSGASARRRAVT
jgi:hypothetical protein